MDEWTEARQAKKRQARSRRERKGSRTRKKRIGEKEKRWCITRGALRSRVSVSKVPEHVFQDVLSGRRGEARRGGGKKRETRKHREKVGTAEKGSERWCARRRTRRLAAVQVLKVNPGRCRLDPTSVEQERRRRTEEVVVPCFGISISNEDGRGQAEEKTEIHCGKTRARDARRRDRGRRRRARDEKSIAES